MGERRKKICLIASSGGHFEQLSRLSPLANKNDVFIITEKTKYNASAKGTYLIKQVNREDPFVLIYLLRIAIHCLFIFLKERPDAVISTGALSCIPMLLIAHIFRRKVIYIESFAKITSPTKTGKLVYKFADVFIVQWPSMKKVYPDAIYLGSIY